MQARWILTGSATTGFEWKGGDTVRPDSGMPFEATVGEPNFKSIWWPEFAVRAARSVARVKLPAGSATGFMVAGDILMTNNHVFEDKAVTSSAKLQFNYRLEANGDPAERDQWMCDPDSLFQTNPDIDYTIVRVKKKNNGNAGDIWGYFDLRHCAAIGENQRVNIIQHPQGRFQKIVFRDNQIKAVQDNYIQYLTDTDYGTSGSPVFDDWFDVVALHNQRVRDPNDPHRWYRNQGFRVEAILNDVGKLIP